MSSEPFTAPLGPVSVTSAGPKPAEAASYRFSGLALLLTNALLKAAVKPVGVGVNTVTTRPRMAIGALVPVRPLVAVSVAVSVWLGRVFSAAAKEPAPLV